ncbi:MAG: DUF1552 domain-containing protein [Acidobacteriia bacterium]|nr:DUF1552 domain-containing protein [Terriglobia bacterium]
MITGKHLARRTFLRGLGAAIALPVLDAMTPAFAATVSANTPRRMAFVYVPNGIIMKDWTPAGAGADFEFSRILKPLEPYRRQLMVLSGLTHNTGRALGDGPGDHARAAASFLTGVHPKKTAGADIHSGISVDQIAAQKIGNATRLASLELGCEDGRLVGNCDSGYSCAYSNSISWRTTATPMPPEVNPRAAFERLFGDASETPEARAKRLLYNKSILDFVAEDTERLKGDLGRTDRRKLDEYLDAVREIERRIEMAERESKQFTPDMEKPAGVPVEFADHVKLMFDLMTLAFQADVTRIATFMICREGSTRTYREIGVNDAHHPLTHHRNNPEWIEKVAKINGFHLEQFAYFVDKLKSTPDGDATLLDRVMVVYGSGLADGNAHTHNDLPVVLAGAGNGALRPGRHVRYPKETPMTNLYVAMLDHMGITPEHIGDSTGELEHLTDLG